MNSSPENMYPDMAYIIRAGDTLWLLAQRFRTTVQAIMSANPTLDERNLQIGRTIYIPQKSNDRTTFPRPFYEGISKAQQILGNHMRMLWTQHVYWTRMDIISAAFDLPDEQLVTARLLRNPTDFEAALKPFYGESIAAEFGELLTEHLKIAGELIAAAKAGNSETAADAEQRWYENADRIADFLGSINPYWSAQEWREMLYDHLAMTKEEAFDILSQNYADSIDTFENIEREALMMADEMTQGIVRQFTEYFL
ncbi:MAG: LysM peptidoglycan-binding domain-containing protein [Lachnospiraceae bacterium]